MIKTDPLFFNFLHIFALMAEFEMDYLKGVVRFKAFINYYTPMHLFISLKSS